MMFRNHLLLYSSSGICNWYELVWFQIISGMLYTFLSDPKEHLFLRLRYRKRCNKQVQISRFDLFPREKDILTHLFRLLFSLLRDPMESRCILVL